LNLRIHSLFGSNFYFSKNSTSSAIAKATNGGHDVRENAGPSNDGFSRSHGSPVLASGAQPIMTDTPGAHRLSLEPVSRAQAALASGAHGHSPRLMNGGQNSASGGNGEEWQSLFQPNLDVSNSKIILSMCSRINGETIKKEVRLNMG